MGAVVLAMFPPKPEVFRRFRGLGWLDVTLDSRAAGVALRPLSGGSYTRYYTMGWLPNVSLAIESDGVSLGQMLKYQAT